MAAALRIALAQLGAGLGEVEENLGRMLALLEQAQAQDVQLVCYPELVLSGYLLETDAYDDELLARCARAEGELASACDRSGLGLVYGTPLRDGGGLRNAVVWLRPGGERRVYAKTHMDVKERRVFAPGGGFVADASAGLGLACCYDLAFPEACRMVALAGARALLVPMAWEVARGFVMEQVLAARAVENVAYVACANQAGRFGPFDFRGGSRVVDPLGRTVCALGTEEGVAIADLDLDWVWQLRSSPDGSTYPLLADRRPELYGGMAAPS